MLFVFVYPYHIVFVSLNNNRTVVTRRTGTKTNYPKINLMSIWLRKHFETEKDDIWNNEQNTKIYTYIL